MRMYDIHLSAIIAKSTNRLLTRIAFVLTDSKKYIFTTGCRTVHKLVIYYSLMI